MKIITKKQEKIQAERQRRLTEKKLLFMGGIVAKEMLNRVGWKDETIPDLGSFIENAASEISYADDEIV